MSEKEERFICGVCGQYLDRQELLQEAIAHLKALILAQAFRSEVSDAASDFVKAHE